LVKGCIATQIPCLAWRIDFCPHFFVMACESDLLICVGIF
jgi:hypothetical protein